MPTEPIGARLKRLRLERGLSQRALSGPGVSYAYISRIEAGARTPSVKALRMLARKLDVAVEYLERGRELGDEDERELRLADAELELRVGKDEVKGEQMLRQIRTKAIAAGDHASATRAQILLALAAAGRGDHLEAVELLAQALATGRLPARTRVDVYAALGRSYAALGAPDRAVQLFENCLEAVTREAPDDFAERLRYAADLSNALSDSGDHERAAAVLKDALALAGPIDRDTQMRLYRSRAHSVEGEGRSREALEYARRAIALLHATEDTVRLGRAYLLAAGIDASEGNPSQAESHLALAERLLGGSPEPADLAIPQIVHAQIALLRQDGNRAVEAAQHALDLLGDLHPVEQGAALLALAQGLALQGEDSGADRAYRRALDLLAAHGRRQEAAKAAAAWGEFLRKRGREDEAAPILQRAAELASADHQADHTR